MTCDAVVIGGGCAGMSAAITLARFGRKVVLIEGDRRLAPVLRGFERQGLHFDTGFHYVGGLGAGEVLDTLFRFLGLAPHLAPVPYRSDGFDVCRFERLGREVAIPYGDELLQERLGRAFPGQEGLVGDYLDDVLKVWNSSLFLNLHKAASADELLSFGDGPTLASRLAACGSDELLQTCLALPCLLYGSTPEEASFANHALVAGSYFSSVHGLRGGGRSLVEGFNKALAEAGVEVICGARVAGIDVENRRLSGVSLADGRRIVARHCIYTGHPSYLPDLLPPGGLRPSFYRRLREYPETPSAFMLFGVLSKEMPLLGGRNLFLTRAVRPAQLLGEQQDTVYLTGGDCLDDGRQVVTAFSTTDFSEYEPWRASVSGQRPAAYYDLKQRHAAALLERIGSGCPELKGNLEIVESASPLTMRDWAASPRGSLYGLRHTAEDFPLLPMTRIDGLLLAGQSVLLPGVLGATVSAMVACSLMLGLEELRKELRQCSRSASS